MYHQPSVDLCSSLPPLFKILSLYFNILPKITLPLFRQVKICLTSPPLSRWKRSLTPNINVQSVTKVYIAASPSSTWFGSIEWLEGIRYNMARYDVQSSLVILIVVVVIKSYCHDWFSLTQCALSLTKHFLAEVEVGTKIRYRYFLNN